MAGDQANVMPAPGALLERAAELTALDAALAERGRLVVVEGPAGVGKSSLLAAARERARAAGTEVLSARGSDLERELPFGVASQLLGPPLARMEPPERRRLLAGLGEPIAALVGQGPGSPGLAAGESELALVQGLFWLTDRLARHAGPAGLLLAVDDAQWADPLSLRFLAHVAVRLPVLPAALVVALRPAERADDLLDRLRAPAGGAVLRPRPLSDAAVGTLVRASFPAAEEPFAEACARATGGNPFLVRELLASLRADGIEPSARAAATVERLVPDTVVGSVLVRLGRLPAAAARLAEAVAVLGDGAALLHAARLAGLDADAASAAADALAAADLFEAGEPLRFAHPLIAAAVHEDLAPLARARAHREAAALLAEAGAPEEVVAAHLLACGPRADPWVVERLRAAAERALAAGAPRGAARFLARAVEEPPADAQRSAVLVDLALAEAAAGLSGADRRLAGALDLIDDRSRRADALLQLCRLRAARAEWAAAADAAERGLGELDADDPRAGKLLAVLIDAAARHTRRRGEALERFAPMAQAAREGAPPREPALQARLASRLAVAGDPADRPRAIALAEASLAASPLVDPDFHGIPFAWAAGALYWAGELERCRTVADTAEVAARERGSAIAESSAALWQTGACHRLGQLDEAAAAARRGLEIAREGWTATLGWTAPILAAVELERGDPDAARAALDALEGADPDLMEHAFALHARARLALAAGDAAAALAGFEAAGRHLREGYRIDNPAVLSWRAPAALAAAAAGDREAAGALAAEAVADARRLGLPLPLGEALRTAGLVAGGDDGLVLLREAVAALDGSAAALERAHAELALGAALRRAGERAAAREPLRRALTLAERLGAAPLAAEAHAELRAAGGRRARARELSGVAALTPTERRIAELAAQGHSNPGIAQRLYLTTKTVEWHLSHVYRKLDIASRGQLPEALDP